MGIRRRFSSLGAHQQQQQMPSGNDKNSNSKKVSLEETSSTGGGGFFSRNKKQQQKKSTSGSGIVEQNQKQNGGGAGFSPTASASDYLNFPPHPSSSAPFQQQNPEKAKTSEGAPKKPPRITTTTSGGTQQPSNSSNRDNSGTDRRHPSSSFSSLNFVAGTTTVPFEPSTIAPTSSTIKNSVSRSHSFDGAAGPHRIAPGCQTPEPLKNALIEAMAKAAGKAGNANTKEKIETEGTTHQTLHNKQRCQLLEAENKRLIAIQSKIFGDSNKRIESSMNEIQSLRNQVNELQQANAELAECIRVTEYKEAKANQLGLEWQRFGRHTSELMKQEVRTYQSRIEALTSKCSSLEAENNLLKKLCLYLDDQHLNQINGANDRINRNKSDDETISLEEDAGCGSSDSSNSESPSIHRISPNGKKENTTMHKNQLDEKCEEYLRRIRQNANGEERLHETDFPEKALTKDQKQTPESAASLINYVQSLENRIKQLERSDAHFLASTNPEFYSTLPIKKNLLLSTSAMRFSTLPHDPKKTTHNCSPSKVEEPPKILSVFSPPPQNSLQQQKSNCLIENKQIEYSDEGLLKTASYFNDSFANDAILVLGTSAEFRNDIATGLEVRPILDTIQEEAFSGHENSLRFDRHKEHPNGFWNGPGKIVSVSGERNDKRMSNTSTNSSGSIGFCSMQSGEISENGGAGPLDEIDHFNKYNQTLIEPDLLDLPPKMPLLSKARSPLFSPLEPNGGEGSSIVDLDSLYSPIIKRPSALKPAFFLPVITNHTDQHKQISTTKCEDSTNSSDYAEPFDFMVSHPLEASKTQTSTPSTFNPYFSVPSSTMLPGKVGLGNAFPFPSSSSSSRGIPLTRIRVRPPPPPPQTSQKQTLPNVPEFETKSSTENLTNSTGVSDMRSNHFEEIPWNSLDRRRNNNLAGGTSNLPGNQNTAKMSLMKQQQIENFEQYRRSSADKSDLLATSSAYQGRTTGTVEKYSQIQAIVTEL